MKKTGRPIAGGILNIVSGALNILGFVGVIIAIVVVTPAYWIASDGFGPVGVFEIGILTTILWIGAIILLIVGILPLIGGIYAVQRKKWGLALAGSIAAIVGSSVMGILATIFTVMAKDEFE